MKISYFSLKITILGRVPDQIGKKKDELLSK